MPIELRWIVSSSASALHAAAAMLSGATLVDAKTAEAIGEEVENLRATIATVGLEPDQLFEHLIPLSVRFDTLGALAEVAAAKIVGGQAAAGMSAGLSRRLTALEAAYQVANPGVIEELELRSEPLRSQWEARGPGLIAAVARLTDPELIVEGADAILVQPVLGGAGAAHWLYNSVRIEGVLANPIAELPEVVRLGWLVAQLNLDLPKYEGELRRDRTLRLGALALLPAVLAAAEEVELTRNSPRTLATAIAAWNPGEVDSEQLVEWWEAYQADPPHWAVALGALDRMMPEDAGIQ